MVTAQSRLEFLLFSNLSKERGHKFFPVKMVSYNFTDFQSSTCQPTKQMKKVKYKLRKDKKGTIEYIIIKEVIQSIHREKKKQLITKTTKTTILQEKSNKANNRILRGPGRGHNLIVPGPTRAMTRWVRWVANDYYFSLDTVIIKEDLANLFKGKQKSACLGLNGDPPNLKQN